MIVYHPPEDIRRCRERAHAMMRENAEHPDWRDRSNAPSVFRFENLFLGALGELAVVKRFKLPWNPHGPLGIRSPDCGDVDVKARRSWQEPLLIVRPWNADAWPYVLALVSPDHTTVGLLGWIYGGLAKQPHWFTDLGKPERPRVYAVPEEALGSMREFEERLRLGVFKGRTAANG